MNIAADKINIRSMVLADLDAIFFIDHEIRRRGQAVTYANLTTEHIFTIDRHVGRLATPVSYIDLIKGDVSELLDLGLVAEVEGHVRGFILGRIAHGPETPNESGIIPILGVHPDYQHSGIGAQMVEALCVKYRSKGIKKVHIDVDRRDKPLLEFVEHLGFGVSHRIDYSRSL